MDNPVSLGLPAGSSSPFDTIKQVNEHGAEYWSARELQSHLGYTDWRNFKRAISDAVKSCKASGNLPHHHFVEANRMVGLGSGSRRSTADFHLSRFACYLIAQNGDPSKPEIAAAQKYFAIQVRRQELSDELAADQERCELRDLATKHFSELSGVAKKVGVQNSMFGIFHDAGYKGLYGGRGCKDIKAKKGIPDGENLMDRMGSTELAANAFRLTQARDKLAESRVSSQQQAIQLHESVGREVRQAIEKIGGTMPENLPAAEHIKEARKRIKKAKPQLKLEERDAKGLEAIPPPSADYDTI